MFSNQKSEAKIAIDDYVVVSLYTDGGGSRRDEFNRMREEMTGSITNPMYVVVDPHQPNKPLLMSDFFQAIDEGWGQKLQKAKRRFLRAEARREKTRAAVK